MRRSAAPSVSLALTLRPVGRGNWAPIELRVHGRHLPPPLMLHVGERVVIGQTTMRVVSIAEGAG